MTAGEEVFELRRPVEAKKTTQRASSSRTGNVGATKVK